MTNKITKHRYHFEDLQLGETIQLGKVQVTKDMIFSFAQEFDPLPFHLNETAANASLLGGLAASGWQTAALCQKMFVDSFLGSVASAGGLGFSQLKWIKPVMVNDTISSSATISELTPSKSKPQWGIVTIDLAVTNQKGKTVLTTQLKNLVERRDSKMETVE